MAFPAGSYPARVVADGAVAYWRLGETSGTTAVDAIGGANGTISGGVTLAQPGALADGDKAMAFNGTTGRIAAPALLLPLSCTLECWVNTNVPGGMSVEHPVLSHRGPTGSDDFVVTVATYWDPGRIRIYSNVGSVNGVGGVVDGAWHHIVIVFTASDTTIYVDGAVDTVGGVAHVAISELIDIGWHSPVGKSFTGSLDDVAIYPTALTAPQIAAHYALRTFSPARPNALPLSLMFVSH